MGVHHGEMLVGQERQAQVAHQGQARELGLEFAVGERQDYNLIWYIEACLSNALRAETYIQDAEREKDTELAELFRKAQADSRKGAELGKQLLRTRLGG
jgi:hypothetical protein